MKRVQPLETVRVGMCTDLDPSEPYTTVTLEVQGVRESLSPCEAREVARLLGVYAKMVEPEEG